MNNYKNKILFLLKIFKVNDMGAVCGKSHSKPRDTSPERYNYDNQPKNEENYDK